MKISENFSVGKRFQAWLHVHERGISFIFWLIISGFMVGLMLLNQSRIKEDNRRQSELIICLLAVHGQNQLITDEERKRCQQISEQIKEEAAQNEPTEPSSPTPPTNSPRPTPQRETNQQQSIDRSSDNNNTPPDEPKDPPDEPEPPEPPTLPEQVIDRVCDVSPVLC